MTEIAKPVSVKPVSVATPAPGKLDAAGAVAASAPAKPAAATEKAPKKTQSELHVKKIYLVEAKIREKMPEGREGLNPKREGSNGFRAFGLYKNGMTVAEFLKLASETKHEGKSVGSMADVRWDKDHGFIELRDE